MLKDGSKRPEIPALGYWLSGQTGQLRSVEYVPGEITSADTNGRPFVRCQPLSPVSSLLPPSLLTSVANRSPSSPSGRATGRSPFLSSVQFKENACHSHVLIHSYGFASRQYPILVYKPSARLSASVFSREI